MKMNPSWKKAFGAAAFAASFSSLALPAAAELDLLNMTIKDVQAGYAAGTFTAVELTTAIYKQIETYNPTYNAWITLDEAGALATAAQIDAMFAADPTAVRSPMFGVPVAIKDPMDVAGLPTTAGSTAFSSKFGGVDIIPDTDAPLVARLRDAGAIIIGKTNIPDFSRSGTNSTSSVQGATLNAYDITRVPGGSSGGSGVAVATGMSITSMAEETGSSITNPASASSLVGIRPTYGLIPGAGVFPLAGTFRDVVGPLGKTVYDAAAMLDVIAGPTPDDPNTLNSEGRIPVGGYVANMELGTLNGARLAVYKPGGWNTVDLAPETQTLFSRELDVLESLGATLVEDPFQISKWRELTTGVPGSGTFSYDIEVYLSRLGPGAAFNSVAEYEALTGNDFYEISRMPGETSAANPISRAELDAYLARRAEMREFFNEVMDDFDIDAIVMPQLAEPVPTLASGDGISRTPGAAVNILGLAGVVTPGGYFDDGTPFAMYFLGRQWSEMEMINFAYDYEQATMHRAAPTLVPEPASVAMLMIGSALIFRRNRRGAGVETKTEAVLN